MHGSFFQEEKVNNSLKVSMSSVCTNLQYLPSSAPLDGNIDLSRFKTRNLVLVVFMKAGLFYTTRFRLWC